MTIKQQVQQFFAENKSENYTYFQVSEALGLNKSRVKTACDKLADENILRWRYDSFVVEYRWNEYQ